MKDAVRPNLVQTLEHTPAFVHGGPFANIAHGCNSVIATETALSYGDYVVTEAGFGADLGAEKFLDIKCRVAGLNPAAVVVVATARALKNGGGVPKDRLNEENVAAVERGLPNLVKHVENIRDVFGLDCVVAINRFYSDTEAELAAIRAAMDKLGVPAVDAECFSKGGAGAEALARTVTDIADRSDKRLTYAYPSDMPLPDKIRAVAQKVYGAADVKFLPAAVKSLAALENTPAAGQPVCIAKTQYSLSDNPALLGPAGRVHAHGARRRVPGGRALYRGAGRRHSADAGPSRRTQCGEDDDIARRRDPRAVLSRGRILINTDEEFVWRILSKKSSKRTWRPARWTAL